MTVSNYLMLVELFKDIDSNTVLNSLSTIIGSFIGGIFALIIAKSQIQSSLKTSKAAEARIFRNYIFVLINELEYNMRLFQNIKLCKESDNNLDYKKNVLLFENDVYREARLNLADKISTMNFKSLVEIYRIISDYKNSCILFDEEDVEILNKRIRVIEKLIRELKSLKF